jgi:hypothetical protein
VNNAVEQGSKSRAIEQNPLLLWMKYRTLSTLHFVDYSLRKDENECKMVLDDGNPFIDCPDILDNYRIDESWNPDGLIVAQSNRAAQIELKPTVRKIKSN